MSEASEEFATPKEVSENGETTAAAATGRFAEDLKAKTENLFGGVKRTVAFAAATPLGFSGAKDVARGNYLKGAVKIAAAYLTYRSLA